MSTPSAFQLVTRPAALYAWLHCHVHRHNVSLVKMYLIAYDRENLVEAAFAADSRATMLLQHSQYWMLRV